MADAESATRSAKELGANNEPGAQLSMRLAEEQMGQAKKSMADGDNKHADSLLIRARADAELAIAEAREKGATVDLQKAAADASSQKAANVGQGAAK
jgi:hypothetical protein